MHSNLFYSEHNENRKEVNRVAVFTAIALTVTTKATLFKIGEILVAAAPVAAFIKPKKKRKK